VAQPAADHHFEVSACFVSFGRRRIAPISLLGNAPNSPMTGSLKLVLRFIGLEYPRFALGLCRPKTR
jgi:hypothetical protein